MPLPDEAQRWVPDGKVRDYCLSTATPKARSRHDFFIRFGFTPASWRVLREALLRHPLGATAIALAREDEYGRTWRVVGPLETPSGARPVITTYWIIRHDDPRPQLTSAIPAAVSSPG